MASSVEEDAQYEAMFADLLDDFSSSGRCELDSPDFGSLSPHSISERSGDDGEHAMATQSLSPQAGLDAWGTPTSPATPDGSQQQMGTNSSTGQNMPPVAPALQMGVGHPNLMSLPLVAPGLGHMLQV
jgi:hypothetical protein